MIRPNERQEDVTLDEKLHVELLQMGIERATLTPICAKDNVYVYRLRRADDSFVLKHFLREADRREIDNYRLLHRLGMRTIQVIAATESSRLLEDLEQSATLRLAREDDMADLAIAASLGRWYRTLHERGKAYVATANNQLYTELDRLTLDHLEQVKRVTGSGDLPFWAFLKTHFQTIRTCVAALNKTLVFNDFYYTNMVVAHDKSEAFMFDFQFLGTGYLLQGINNVTCQLRQEAARAFLDSYQSFSKKELDIDRLEYLVDALCSPLITLIMAAKRAIWPTWANESLEKLENGMLEHSLEKLVRYNNDVTIERGHATKTRN